MNMQQTMQLHQELNVKMTHELAQAISLLQLSSIDLIGYLEMAATENPLIEADSMLLQTDAKAPNGKARDYTDFIEVSGLTQQPTIFEHLYSQTICEELTLLENKVFKYFALNINENGYLEIDIQDVCSKFQIDKERAESILQLIQQCDPPGIGARNLQECLLLQLKRLPEIDQKWIDIIKNHFPDFANKKWKKIAVDYNISLIELQKLLDTIQGLNPWPGAVLQSPSSDYIVPDIIINYDNGEWRIELFEDRYTLKLNQHYYNELKNHSENRVRKYFNQMIQEYSFLKKSIEQRRKTIIKVMGAIIKRQESFLLNSINPLRPMTMKEIAEEAGVHESTVSRIAKNKYVNCPAGTFLLRNLFSASIPASGNGESVTNDFIKAAIEKIINIEDKSKPYSDQDVAEILKKQGLSIARRTVAKYRIQLKIPSSSKRKRFT